ncbi:hypothetical protein NDU88_006492 [Pleurodeles waltl]|uniref:Secreted protein n=1 Tax=Pleurodeles waltl TaxID=8319 RepID=A0AAV7RLR3_PLEWA|nr:hypothetical protein NDU88_006492 [Pleurodeles waltl]
MSDNPPQPAATIAQPPFLFLISLMAVSASEDLGCCCGRIVGHVVEARKEEGRGIVSPIIPSSPLHSGSPQAQHPPRKAPRAPVCITGSVRALPHLAPGPITVPASVLPQGTSCFVSAECPPLTTLIPCLTLGLSTTATQQA